MLKILSRYYHTLKYLKPIQIRYQVWYRLRNKFFPVQYLEGVKAPKFQELKLFSFPDHYTHYLCDNHFQFLNLKKKFKNEIDWNYSSHGKLWTYHLNYFDYLHQSGMDWKTGRTLIESFLKNPQKRTEGMEPYPISLRTINWIKFLAKHEQFPEVVVDSLYNQFEVLSKKLEYHLLGNHLLENGFSMLYGAVFFQDKKFSQLSRKILKAELKEQILADGGHFELSPMYHIILLQRALDGYNLLKNNEHHLQDIEQLLENTIPKMVGWLKTIMFRNGDIPMLNDCIANFSLAPITILEYSRNLGFDKKFRCLSESNYRKYTKDKIEVIFDGGGIKPDYQPAHNHSDSGSFVLYHNLNPIIVDTGTSTYELNDRRRIEKSAFAHNSVKPINIEPSDFWGRFRVGKREKVKIIEETKSSVLISRNIYKINCIKLRRYFQLKDNKVIIVDKAYSKKKEKYIALMHFNHDCKIEMINESAIMGDAFQIFFDGCTKLAIDNYEQAIGYNNLVNAKKVIIEFSSKLETNIIFNE